MCGIVGIVNYKKDLSNEYPIIRNMNNTITSRGPDEDGYYFEKNVVLGHKRLIVIDPKNGKQPMSYTYQNNSYTIIYNGQIYNTKELHQTLKKEGFTFNRS